MAVFIGATGKTFTTKKQVVSELERLYTLAWIAESKIVYDSWGLKNPQQKAAMSRLLGRAIKLQKKYKDLVSENEAVTISRETYYKFKGIKY